MVWMRARGVARGAWRVRGGGASLGGDCAGQRQQWRESESESGRCGGPRHVKVWDHGGRNHGINVNNEEGWNV